MTNAALAAQASTSSTRSTSSPATLLVIYVAVSLALGAILLAYQNGVQPSQLPELAAPLWTMLVGAVCNASCAIVGCYLVLRRLSLLGDAITHAVLPGIALAYYFTGSVSGWPIFVGALALGILTSALTQAISSLGRVSEDASLGIVFTSLFAAGVIMIGAWAHADLDPGCVLYGTIDYAAFDLTTVWGYEISRPLLTLVPALVATILFVAILWKELKIVAFDHELATAMGFQVAVIHYLFMTMVAGVAVASFESVGSILVVAMLIVPPATAALMTNRLIWMMAWSVAIGATSSVFGYLVAAGLNTSVAGAMSIVAGIQFGVAVFVAPRGGLLSRWLRNQALAIRIAAEDVLTRLYRAEESAGAVQKAFAAPTGYLGWLAGRRLFRAGWVKTAPAGVLQLTDSGRKAARGLIRAHRLWESYLDTHFDLPRDHLHDAAERMEHFLGADLQDELAQELADRAVDPHGKAIPQR